MYLRFPDREYHEEDIIIPKDSNIIINLTVKNLGPSDAKEFVIRLKECKPPQDCSQGSEDDFIVFDTEKTRMLKVGEKYTISFYGLRLREEGYYKFRYDISSDEPSSPDQIIPRCRDEMGYKIDNCPFSWRLEISSKQKFPIQVVSIDNYYQYKINRNIENLSLIMIILTFFSFLSAAISIKDKIYAKKNNNKKQ